MANAHPSRHEESGFTLSSGDRVHVRRLSGVVADDRHAADTRFYSTGGGGYVGPHGGQVAAPEICSVTIRRQTVWITDDAGRDHSVDFQNASIPLRVGQRVTALFCQLDGAGVERCEYLINHSSQRTFNLAREFGLPLDFRSRYSMGPVVALLLSALFLGCLLIAVPSFQPASDRDYGPVAVAPMCRNLEPRDPRMPARAQEQLARRYEQCERWLQQAAEARKAAWHAWWVPAACAVAWLFLLARNASRKTAFGQRLSAEYLAALDHAAAALDRTHSPAKAS